MSDLHLIDRPNPPLADVINATLLFARHGATSVNLAGQRCGGDIDPPLAEAGRVQALELARTVARLDAPPDVVVTSDLLRTLETARIVCQALGTPRGPAELIVLPSLRERSLGFWNLEPIEDHDADLARGDTPPCGESADAFRRRIEAALDALRPLLHRRVLVVASKGVGRVWRECTGAGTDAPLRNGELVQLSVPMAPASSGRAG